EYLLPFIVVEHLFVSNDFRALTYSSFSAIMGFTLAAFLAGKNPANAPATTNSMVAKTAVLKSTDGFLKNSVSIPKCIMAQLMNLIRPIPAIRPIYPAISVMVIDSCKKSLMIDLGVAPIAFLTPISLVLSFTTISMILLTPTMPAIMVPKPTIQTNMRIPSNKLMNFWNSSTLFHI